MMNAPQVGVVKGSSSDWEVMKHAAMLLKQLGIHFEAKVVSAHRTPDLLFEYAASAGARGAAHLPGMIASKTIVPVLGVPVPSKYLKGMDSLLSIVQMPKGIPVATFAIGEAGAANAALFAASLIARYDDGLAAKLNEFRRSQSDTVMAMDLPDVE